MVDIPTYPEREVFPSSPLEFVACQIRFPRLLSLERPDVVHGIHELLADVLPVYEEEMVQSLTIGPGRVDQPASELRHRFMDRTRRLSAVFGRTDVTVETTDYQDYSSLRVVVQRVFDALDQVGRPAGLDRVGLRYINEIRVPTDITSARDWIRWLAPQVLGVLGLGEGYQIGDVQQVLQLRSETATVTLRYASLSGTGVVGNGPLRRRSPVIDGPFFVIDTDSYGAADDDGLAPYDVPETVDLVDQLHRPIGDLFHRSITDDLREEFRKPR